MKRHNIIIYGHSDDLGYQLFNILASEHRLFIKDPARRVARGTYRVDWDKFKHPSITKTPYHPVECIIIARWDNYTNELIEEVNYLKPDIKILVLNSYEEYTIIDNKYPNLDITFAGFYDITTCESLYFYDKPDIKGKSDDFWGDLFNYCLFNFNYEKTKTKIPS